jgi:hypothetical protein
MILLFAAHQGEEFVLALPAIMLVGAYFILRWANQKDPDEEASPDDGSDEPAEEVPTRDAA